MAVKIRLTRTGSKNQPYYRIVAIESQVKRDGKNLEVIGHINPQINPPEVTIDKDRFNHWLKLGAKPSEAVRKLIK